MTAQLCEYTNTTELCFKWANRMLCELYFNKAIKNAH